MTTHPRSLVHKAIMTSKRIEQFFDRLAPHWDEEQDCKGEVKRALLEKVGIGRGARVLDVACGTGAITEELHDITGENVLGIDVSGEMINVAREKFAGKDWATFEKADFFCFEREQKFDYIVIYNAYPHFMDVSALRDKAYSLLKEGGRLAIIHSIGRNCLNSHHKQHAMHVSRMIGAPLDEAKSFADFFAVEIAEEDDEHYLLVLKKI